jgi:hypothetical protein
LRARIQTSNIVGVIFQLLLKQQKTNPSAGNPASSRVGVCAVILRFLSLT